MIKPVEIPAGMEEIQARIGEIKSRFRETGPQGSVSFQTLVGANPPARERTLDPSLEQIIAGASQRHGVDSALIKAVIHAESGFNPRAVSRAGAQGLMQLMPSTAGALGISNPFDPAQNVEAGTRYLRQLLDRHAGDLPRTLAAYNAGPGAVRRYGGIPPFAETQWFVQRVLSLADQYRSGPGRF